MLVVLGWEKRTVAKKGTYIPRAVVCLASTWYCFFLDRAIGQSVRGKSLLHHTHLLLVCTPTCQILLFPFAALETGAGSTQALF